MTQRWWERDEVAYMSLAGGLTQFNDQTEGDRLDERYERMIRALMQFAFGYSDAIDKSRTRDGSRVGEALKVRRYVSDCAMWAFDADFMNGKALRDLVAFRPLIASDEVVRDIRESVRRLDLTEDELQAARSAHKALVDAVAQFDASPDDHHRGNVGWSLGQLLYVVRCNTDHSEKTPFGPDLQKAQRDHDVLSVALPALEQVVLRSLDRPQSRLAVYGTLRRGEPNHSQIADLGVPVKGVVPGILRNENGYPIFRWTLSGADVSVELFESERLTRERWTKLDSFEGSNYRRILVPIRLSNGQRVVTSIYGDARY